MLAPDSMAAARDAYEEAGRSARTVVSAVAREMGLDREAYRERVTESVNEAARDAIFAGMLAVSVADRPTFDAWRSDHEGPVHLVGHEAVDHVAWHTGPDGEAVAATFQDETDAAVATLRRQAFGRLYRDRL